VLYEYSSAVLEIENAKVGGQSDSARSVSVATLPSSEGSAHLSERPRNSSSDSAAADSVDIETDDKDDSDDRSDDFNGEDNDDDDDGEEGSEDEVESEEDEDGGFFDSEEGGRDDPLEHALDAMLDIEAEANMAHKRARKK
jgi:hypothetical protein